MNGGLPKFVHSQLESARKTGWMKRLPYGKESDRRRKARHDTSVGGR